MKLRTALLVFLSAFLVFLLLGTPAARLQAWLAPKDGAIPLIQLQGLSGSIGGGSASGLLMRQQPVLRDLHWDFLPSQLLLGRVAIDLRAADPVLEARVSSGLGGQRIGDLRLVGELRSLLTLAGQAYLPFAGQVGLELQQAHLRQGWPVSAAGRLEIRRLAYTLARDPVVFGDYEATIQPEGDDLVILVQTLTGPLQANGDGRLKPDRSYEFHLQLKAPPEAPPMVQNFLRSQGSPDAQGYYHLRKQGQLPPSGGAAPPA
ncbi:MAG TPA: type II secretion system protein N [Solimonas sp.]|nr:type II secretion system protein N [Solimonas sp.]